MLAAIMMIPGEFLNWLPACLAVGPMDSLTGDKLCVFVGHLVVH